MPTTVITPEMLNEFMTTGCCTKRCTQTAMHGLMGPGATVLLECGDSRTAAKVACRINVNGYIVYVYMQPDAKLV